MEFCSIASGSRGNCIYVGTQRMHLLLDTGISARRVECGLEGIGLKASEIGGILLTHEHTDHIGGLGVMMRKYGLKVYATRGTIDRIMERRAVGDVDPSLFSVIEARMRFRLGDIEAEPIATSHDAAEPVAYVLRAGDKSMAVMTDLGKYDGQIVEALSGLDLLLLEANHDVGMLKRGSYPERLKRRILSDRGHLSNKSAGKLLSAVLHDNIGQIILGHLSAQNNDPALALRTVRDEIDIAENPYRGDDFPMCVAMQDESTGLIKM